jgi:kynurenine formamidase
MGKGGSAMSDDGSMTSSDKRTVVNRRSFIRVSAASSVGVVLADMIKPMIVASSEERGRVGNFIRKVKEARLFDLSPVWDENSPIAGVNPSYSMKLNRTHAAFDPADPDFSDDHTRGTRGQFGDGGQLSFTSEVQHFSGQHGAPSIDAIGHIGRNGFLFGHVDAAAATSDLRGIGRSGVGAHLDIAHYPAQLLVNRGVLLDVARFIQGDLSPLPADFEITAQHLTDTVKRQRVKLERGDTVLIRTGWGKFFTDDLNRYKGDSSPGPSVDGAQFLVNHGASVVGNDTLTFEKRPPLVFAPTFQVFPVHMLLIADNGINIIENFFLEELAAAEVYEFLLVVPPLKIRGGSGSALRAFALVPKGDDD